jgi:hypothetical protein
MNVDFIDLKMLVHLRRRLSEAMPKAISLPVPERHYPHMHPELAANLTLGILQSSEVVISVFKCKDDISWLAKLYSLGMAESTSTLCVMTNYRIIYRSVTSNARGVRRQWEASVPIYAVRSVFWSNFYSRSNQIMALVRQIPGLKACACFFACCPYIEDKTPHFWMGHPGVSVRVLLGNQRNYGVVMNGNLIWYCGAEDSVTKSIVSLTNLHYEVGAIRNRLYDAPVGS